MNENSIIKASIFAIYRLRMGIDGHGVTTLVYFISYPLNCAYCLNDRMASRQAIQLCTSLPVDVFATP